MHRTVTVISLLMSLVLLGVWLTMSSSDADVEVDAVTQQVRLMSRNDLTRIDWFLRSADVRVEGRTLPLDSVILVAAGNVEVLVQRRGIGIPAIKVDARDSSARVQLIDPVLEDTQSVSGVVIELRALTGTTTVREEAVLAFRSGATLGVHPEQPVFGTFAHYLVRGRIDVRSRSIFAGDQFVASSVNLGPGDFVSTDPIGELATSDLGAENLEAAGAIVIGNEPGLRVRALFTSKVVHVWRVDGKQISESPRLFATFLGDPVLRFLAAALGLVAVFVPLVPSAAQRRVVGQELPSPRAGASYTSPGTAPSNIDGRAEIHMVDPARKNEGHENNN